MVFTALLLITAQWPVDVHAGENPLTQFELKRSATAHTFVWKDSTDALRGTISAPVRAGQDFRITATVQPLEGPDFEGPVTFSLRPLNDRGGADSVTVAKSGEEKSWATTMRVREAGVHRLEVSWTSTHRKVVRGELAVEEPGLPPWVAPVSGVSLVLAVVGIAAWVLLTRKQAV